MPEEQPPTFGPNAWLVEEMYDQYRDDPESVSESWRDFFADYRLDSPRGPAGVTGNGSGPAPAPAPPAPARPASGPAPAPAAAASVTRAAAAPAAAPP
ncbi:MAG TPA: hypothetical protein VFO65_03115, partial [Acidimicrobiales bacterium]|nr:hypothetical protein [Acidimicrobiales bacterium]